MPHNQEGVLCIYYILSTKTLALQIFAELLKVQCSNFTPEKELAS